jgi:hypothetical protein
MSSTITFPSLEQVQANEFEYGRLVEDVQKKLNTAKQIRVNQCIQALEEECAFYTEQYTKEWFPDQPEEIECGECHTRGLVSNAQYGGLYDENLCKPCDVDMFRRNIKANLNGCRQTWQYLKSSQT